MVKATSYHNIVCMFLLHYFRYAENVNQHIGALGNKVEEQLKEINQKCSDLQKQENHVRKCLKKLSANTKSKQSSNAESHKSKTSKDQSYVKVSNGSSIQSSEEDYLKNIDYHQIIKSAMKNYPECVRKNKENASSKSYDDDRDIIDVDEVCSMHDKGI